MIFEPSGIVEGLGVIANWFAIAIVLGFVICYFLIIRTFFKQKLENKTGLKITILIVLGIVFGIGVFFLGPSILGMDAIEKLSSLGGVVLIIGLSFLLVKYAIKKDTSKIVIVSFVLSIVSLVYPLYGIGSPKVNISIIIKLILGIFGAVTALIGFRMIKKYNLKGKWLALVSLIISIARIYFETSRLIANLTYSGP